MRARGLLGMLLLVTLAAVGCRGPLGTWQLREIVPASAERQFDLRLLRFEASGNFTGEMDRLGQTVVIGGKYEFDNERELLTLFEDEGIRQYRARICAPCATLELMDLDASQRWIATFARR